MRIIKKIRDLDELKNLASYSCAIVMINPVTHRIIKGELYYDINCNKFYTFGFKDLDSDLNFLEYTPDVLWYTTKIGAILKQGGLYGYC